MFFIRNCKNEGLIFGKNGLFCISFSKSVDTSKIAAKIVLINKLAVTEEVGGH